MTFELNDDASKVFIKTESELMIEDAAGARHNTSETDAYA